MMSNPTYYHLHHKDELDDLPFWLALAEGLGDPILELGCGTGRLLIPFIQAGYDVIGLDNDYKALTYLRCQLPKKSLVKVKIFHAEMGNYHIAQKFSLIFLACNTLSTLKKSRRQKVYSQIHAHLLENGVFAATFPNPAYLVSLPSVGESEIETSFAHPQSGNPVQVSSGWERSERYITFYWHYDHLLDDGQVDRETVDINHRLISLEDYQEELLAADLPPIKIYGDFEKSEYRTDSPYLIMIAKKGGRF